MVVTAAVVSATAPAVNASINLGNVAVNLSSRVPGGKKEQEIRDLSLAATVNPNPGELRPLVRVPLMDIIMRTCKERTSGNSHVVYARPSIGKTTAFLGLMAAIKNHNGQTSTKTKTQALMITGAPRHEPYLSYMAGALGIEDPEDVLPLLVAGMRTVPPSPSSILILDEMNWEGEDKCNIKMVDVLMRHIRNNNREIHLVVVTQDPKVADELCDLNKWQKIGPMDGMSLPTRQEIRQQKAKVPSPPIKWNNDVVEWDVQHLSQFIDVRFAGKRFKNGDDRSWLVKGMTPMDAEEVAIKNLESDETNGEETWAEALETIVAATRKQN